MADDEFLNVRQTARRLGVHPNTVRNWSDQGILIDRRVPGSRYRRFSAVEVEALHRGRLEGMDDLTWMRTLLDEALDLLDQKDPLWRYHGQHSWRR